MAFRDGREIDVGVGQSGPDMRVLDATHTTPAHHLQIHDLLVIGTIVVHDVEDRDTMMGRRPQCPQCVHEITITLYRDTHPPILAVGKRSAERTGCTVTHANAA